MQLFAELLLLVTSSGCLGVLGHSDAQRNVGRRSQKSRTTVLAAAAAAAESGAIVGCREGKTRERPRERRERSGRPARSASLAGRAERRRAECAAVAERSPGRGHLCARARRPPTDRPPTAHRSSAPPPGPHPAYHRLIRPPCSSSLVRLRPRPAAGLDCASHVSLSFCAFSCPLPTTIELVTLGELGALWVHPSRRGMWCFVPLPTRG